MTEAEFERFAALQQQVASVGNQHAADDAGDRDAAKRFEETVARLKGANIGGQRGRRSEQPELGHDGLILASRSTAMSEIRGKKILSSDGFAALTGGAPSPIHAEDVQPPRRP